MSDDDIDNMDFDLPADLVAAPVNSQEQQLTQLESQMEGMFPGLGNISSMLPQQTPMFVPNPPSAAALEDSKMWLRIYPCYIDKKKSRLQGRKISVQDAVEKPCAFYMAKAAELLGLSVVLESEKRHPRDPFTFGRLRVMQKNSLAGLKNKHQILVAISKKLEESVGLIPDEKGLIAAYAKFSLSELSPMPDPLPEAASQTAGPPVVSSSNNPNPPTVPASSSSSVKTKKKKEKRKILRIQSMNQHLYTIPTFVPFKWNGKYEDPLPLPVFEEFTMGKPVRVTITPQRVFRLLLDAATSPLAPNASIPPPFPVVRKVKANEKCSGVTKKGDLYRRVSYA